MSSRLGLRFVLPAFLIVAAGVVGAWALSRYGKTSSMPVSPPGTTGKTGASDPGATGGETDRNEVKPPLPPFAVLFAGELNGRMIAPPCVAVSTGGIERIEGGIQASATGMRFTMVLDTGDLVDAPGDAGAFEMREAMLVMGESGVAVSAVGERDLLIGLDRWRATKNQFAMGLAVICANLTDARGTALVPPAAMLPAGERRVLCVATLSPSFEGELREAGVDVRIGDPEKAIRAALENIKERDFVIHLSHAPRDETARLHASITEVDMTITAHAGEFPSLEPELVDGRPLLDGGEGWRYLSRAVFAGQPDSTELVDHGTRAVGEAIAGSPLHEFHVEMLREFLSGKGVLASSYGESATRWPEEKPVYVGEQACVRCHAEEHASWSRDGDPHSGAMGSLRKGRLTRFHQCLTCHATGVGAPGGYVPPAKQPAGVSCEACHGPASAHVDSEGSTPLLDARASCIRCHTPDRSPEFDFDEAWKEVGHGK